ncbi:5-deoxy-glucuronate isomerase [Plantactinospora sp. BC1]|uniref:5-deoxy-glucuronate isomerase n=1 Tax=Plantactinospora sp. BC1 TaxID=2108470 RepID=UPI000D174B5F|nr:5-deoxy-glucuronate isomerase [Plantactinospora sp. BC1]AVT34215.1 5-deoxy-glucuronate isomerase [Plantactinospora sp. BC1]
MDYRYHCTIPAADGRNTLPFNPCRLLDFSLLRLPAGGSWTGDPDGREILAVVLGGTASFTVGEHRFADVGRRPDVFSGKPHSVYIPAGATVTVEAVTDVEIALPSAPSDLATDPYVIAPEQVASGRWGAANFGRTYHQILTEISQPELPARRLIVGETYTPSGNWSTYPPHRHRVDNLPAEAAHEEMYYYRVDPAGGFGISRVYTDEGYEENVTIREHVMQMMPEGYHTVVSAPGYTTYFLWFLAGTQRTQGAREDADLAWVGQTVPTLRSMGL